MPNLQTQAQIGVVSATPETSSGYFVQVPVELLKSDLSSSALRLYLLLLSYGGPKSCAWPGQARLATDLKLSERRVRDLLTELEAAALIQIEHVAGTSNLYHLHRFELRGLPGIKQDKNRADSRILPAEKCQGERQKSATELHVLESKNMCEEKVSPKNSEKKEETNDFTLIGIFNQEFIQAGLTPLVAMELTQIVLNNGRELDYVKGLVAASREKGIHNPVGFIRFMVLRNSDSVCPKARPKPEKTNLAPPLDFAKYTSGKYAYLTNHKELKGGEIEPSKVESDLPSPMPPDAQTEVVTIQSPRPEYLKLRQVIAETFGLDTEKVLTEWGKVLGSLADCPQVGYFIRLWGWLEGINEVKYYRLVFRNRFDLRAGQRCLNQLKTILLAIYGLDLAIDCQSLA